jgi:hypothetical protein
LISKEGVATDCNKVAAVSSCHVP